MLWNDPTALIRVAAIYLFALTGTGLVVVSSYIFLTKGTLPDQLYTLLTGIIGASFTLVGYHSNTFAAAMTQRIVRDDTVALKIEKDTREPNGTKQTQV